MSMEYKVSGWCSRCKKEVRATAGCCPSCGARESLGRDVVLHRFKNENPRWRWWNCGFRRRWFFTEWRPDTQQGGGTPYPGAYVPETSQQLAVAWMSDREAILKECISPGPGAGKHYPHPDDVLAENTVAGVELLRSIAEGK